MQSHSVTQLIEQQLTEPQISSNETTIEDCDRPTLRSSFQVIRDQKNIFYYEMKKKVQ